MKAKDDVTESLKPYWVNKDREDLVSLMNGVENPVNPLSLPPRDTFYDIVTDREALNDVRHDLGCQQIGKRWHQESVAGCFDDEKQFEKPVHHRKMKNLTPVANKSTVRCKNKKLMEIKSTRDLFSRLFHISTQENTVLLSVNASP